MKLRSDSEDPLHALTGTYDPPRLKRRALKRQGVGVEQTHQFDQVPSADEESRNTLEVIGGRGET